jgi:hypothetical protein
MMGLSWFAIALCMAAAHGAEEIRMPWEKPKPMVHRVNFTTTAGEFVIELHDEYSPLGVARFLELVEAGFFTDQVSRFALVFA